MDSKFRNMQRMAKSVQETMVVLRKKNFEFELESPSMKANLTSVNSIELFSLYIYFIGCLGAIPFTWDKNGGKLSEETRPHRRVLYFGVKFLTTILTLYLILRFLHMKFYQEQDFVNMTIHFVWMIAFLINCVINVNLVREKDAILYFINQLVSAIYLFEGSQQCRRESYSKLEKLIFGFAALACVQIPFLTILHIHSPASSQYIASLILAKNYNFWIHTLSAVVEVLLYVSMWNLIIFYVCFHYAYSLNSVVWVKKIKSQITKASPKKIRSFLIYYRILQILNRSYNDTSSTTLMVGHKIIILILTVTSSYFLVHFYYTKFMIYLSNAVVLVGVVAFQLIAYPAVSALFKVSNGIHSIFLPRLPVLAYHRRFIKSCGPLKVWVSSFYFFRPFTPMKFFRIEFTYTMKIHYYLRR